MCNGKAAGDWMARGLIYLHLWEEAAAAAAAVVLRMENVVVMGVECARMRMSRLNEGCTRCLSVRNGKR